MKLIINCLGDLQFNLNGVRRELTVFNTRALKREGDLILQIVCYIRKRLSYRSSQAKILTHNII